MIFVYGDVNGVVIVPRELTLEILEEAEKVVATENIVRSEMEKPGAVPLEMYRKYGKF